MFPTRFSVIFGANKFDSPFSPVFNYIPQSALSAIIIAAVLPMIKFGDIFTIYHSKCV